jgi:L,D-transpeptidase YcbB
VLILTARIGVAMAQEAGDSSVGPMTVIDRPPPPVAAKTSEIPAAPRMEANASTMPSKLPRAPEQAAVPAAAPVKSEPIAAPSGAPVLPNETPKESAAPIEAPAKSSIAAEPTVAPDPMAALDPADRAVAEKIRDLFATKGDKIFTSKRERSAAETFYQNRGFAPLWLDKGIKNRRAKSAIARLKDAGSDGLDLNDYKTPDFAGLSSEALAEADLKLSQTVLTYARHVQAGRFPYTRVSHNMELAQTPPEQSDVLARMADAADAGKALDEFSPQHEPYKKLKAVLAHMRGKGGASKMLPDGEVLKLNAKSPMEDPRVPVLRDKLGLAGDASDLKYDAKLAEAVKKFQRANELPATGNLDSRTVKELNGPSRDKQIELVVANMERWRWYPRDLGNAHVLVNLPDFSLSVMHNGAQAWTTRIVIGKQDMPTPLLTESMKHITINPTWNVPPSIVHNEYLPALQQDPTVLARMGLKVIYNRDGSVHIYQPPGEANALGRIRFNFPNRFLVYQHDTPDKHFFAHDVRAYSHGCMRVQDPAKYAEVLFNIARPSENWTADRVKRMFGSGEQDIQLPVPIWVHLTYQSAFVDEAGKLQTRRDVYNIDSRTIAAIKSERAMIEPIQERKQEVASSGQRRVAAPPPPSRVLSFFEAFFGGRPAQAQARPVPPGRITR